MNKQKGILTAGLLGFTAVLGILLLRKFLNNKEYNAYYNDFHRHFQNHPKEEDHHGVEFLSMQ